MGIALRRLAAADGVRRADFEGDGNLRVEVKSPYVQIPGSSWNGDDSYAIRKGVSDAGRQLRHGSVNLIVIVPLLRTPVRWDRNQLLKAAIGDWASLVPISLDPAVPADEPRNVFRAERQAGEVLSDRRR
jgi:hypothetical protein